MMGKTLHLDRRSGTWPAYAAASWAVAFGCLSFYWAAGGHLGLGTLAETIQDKVRGRDDVFILVVWVTGALKVALGLLPLALVRHWHTGVPKRLLRAGAGICGAATSLYGAVGIVNGARTELGIFQPNDANGARWYLFFWGPVWLTGGLLFLGSVWRTRDEPGPTQRHDRFHTL